MAIYNGGLNIVNISASTSGDGNAITSLSADGNVITATRGATFVTDFDLELGSGNQYLMGASSQTGNINTARTSGAYYNGSDLYASGFYVSSSRKVKENINPTKVSGEDMINSVSVVDFNYIDDESKSPKVGFIAEDTDPLFSTRERKVMDSANCIGILMKAVQELSTKVKNLTSELETLTSKVEGGK